MNRKGIQDSDSFPERERLQEELENLRSAKKSPNTNERARIFRRLLELNANPMPVVIEGKDWLKRALKTPRSLNYLSLHQTWAQIETAGEDQFPESLNMRRNKENYTDPSHFFLSCVESGYYPPPEILLCLADCFKLYRESQGKISMDEAFFGKPHAKKKNPAYQERVDFKFLWFQRFYINDEFGQFQGKSREEKAELFSDELKELGSRQTIAVDTFIRSYDRWNSAQTTKSRQPKRKKNSSLPKNDKPVTDKK